MHMVAMASKTGLAPSAGKVDIAPRPVLLQCILLVRPIDLRALMDRAKSRPGKGLR